MLGKEDKSLKKLHEGKTSGKGGGQSNPPPLFHFICNTSVGLEISRAYLDGFVLNSTYVVVNWFSWFA